MKDGICINVSNGIKVFDKDSERAASSQIDYMEDSLGSDAKGTFDVCTWHKTSNGELTN